MGSGAGFDPFITATHVGATGRVTGIDMTPEMLAKSRATAECLEFNHVEFREGLAENLPVDDGWADVVISNGVINLCADKQAVFASNVSPLVRQSTPSVAPTAKRMHVPSMSTATPFLAHRTTSHRVAGSKGTS